MRVSEGRGRVGVGMETGEAPKRNQLCDGFFASQLLDSAGGEGRGVGGVVCGCGKEEGRKAFHREVKT